MAITIAILHVAMASASACAPHSQLARNCSTWRLNGPIQYKCIYHAVFCTYACLHAADLILYLSPCRGGFTHFEMDISQCVTDRAADHELLLEVFDPTELGVANLSTKE